MLVKKKKAVRKSVETAIRAAFFTHTIIQRSVLFYIIIFNRYVIYIKRTQCDDSSFNGIGGGISGRASAKSFRCGAFYHADINNAPEKSSFYHLETYIKEIQHCFRVFSLWLMYEPAAGCVTVLPEKKMIHMLAVFYDS